MQTNNIPFIQKNQDTEIRQGCTDTEQCGLNGKKKKSTYGPVRPSYIYLGHYLSFIVKGYYFKFMCSNHARMINPCGSPYYL